MNLIFTNITGVFNNEGSVMAFRSHYELDPVAVRLLQRLAKDTDASIVLTSHWRWQFALHELAAHFRRAGGSKSLSHRFNGITGPNEGCRGYEIETYLRLQRIPLKSHYVILDVDKDEFSSEQQACAVICDSKHGFGIDEYYRARTLFGAI